VISSSQRPLPDNTQNLQQTDIHASGGIRTQNLSRRVTADLHLRQRSHWDRHNIIYIYLYVLNLFDESLIFVGNFTTYALAFAPPPLTHTHTHTHTQTDTPTRTTVIYVWIFNFVNLFFNCARHYFKPGRITSALGIQIKQLRKPKTCYTPPQVCVIVLKQFLIRSFS